MPSAKSYCNRTLFLKNMLRFWPIWAFYSVIWLFLLPAQILNENNWSWTAERALRMPLDLLPEIGVILAGGFGVLCAMAVFSYLYNNRAVGMIHALPLRRVDLFWTNFLSGLSFLLLPNLAITLLSLLAEAVSGSVNIGSLCMWLVVQSLVDFFFYAFAVFCAMFTGHILALPVFYGILNILVFGVLNLIQSLLRRFLYGFEGFQKLTELAVWLTPAFKLVSNMRVRTFEDAPPAFYGLHLALLYAAVGVVFLLLALVVYEKRHLETAGEVVTVPWVKPIFKYGVAFCSAVTFGMFLDSILNLPDSPWSLLLLLLLCGVVGYFAAEMLLKKSFRVIQASWKGCAVFLVVLTAGVLAMVLDVTGFERRVPNPAQIESAVINRVLSLPRDELNYANIELTEPEELELLTQVHQAAIASKDVRREYHQTEIDGITVTDQDTTDLEITYILKNGTVMERTYDLLPIAEKDLQNPESLTARLTELLNLPGLADRTYFYFIEKFEAARLVDAEVTMLIENRDGAYESVVVPSSALPDLLEAVRSDLAAGRLGRRYLLNDLERKQNCYVNDLQLSFTVPFDGAVGNSYYTVDIGLETTASNTLAVLERCGVFTGENRPMTHVEYEQWMPRRNASMQEDVEIPQTTVVDW